MGTDHGQALHRHGPGQRRRQCVAATHGVPDVHTGARGGDHGACAVFDASRHSRRVTVTWRVDHDQAIGAGEIAGEVAPRTTRLGEAVDQHERRLPPPQMLDGHAHGAKIRGCR